MRSLIIALSLLAPAVARAQDDCLEQIKFPEVGRWAEYRATYNADPYTIRYAVTDAESRGGKQLQWVEMKMSGGKKDQSLIYQMLVPGSVVEVDQVQEVVFKHGDQPAMKMDGMMVDMIRKQLEQHTFHREACKGVSLVGKESVTVPAGRFSSLHFRSAEEGIDTWLSSQLPFSLVKSTGKNFQVELTAHGEGATSSITETPQEVGGMGGPSGTR
jgi:hypothetical protein